MTIVRGVEPRAPGPSDRFEVRDGEAFCSIRGVDAMAPFLMNIPTDSDLWMFVTSTGGLTAGRRDPDGALFPYETVDRLADAPHHTGPVTLVRHRRAGGAPAPWEPFAPADVLPAGVERTLAKSVIGNRVVFEELHRSAGLRFGYEWCGSDETGWVRTAWLENLGGDPVTVSLLDGVRNLLPSGAPLRLHQQASCLVDAYRRADLDPETGLGVYALTARISDRPEPAEVLRATTAWCHGLPRADITLSGEAVRAFRRGEALPSARTWTGRRGSYLAGSTFALAPGETLRWRFGLDTQRGHADIARLRARLRDPESVARWTADALRQATEGLERMIGGADGAQLTARTHATVHHVASVLYNLMRGGAFADPSAIAPAEFAAFLAERHRAVAARHAALLAGPATIQELRGAAAATADPDLQRLALEYLPLWFARRHGDPSRPWNRFSIRVRHPDGGRALRYEGNWRDLFQNWEALGASHPRSLLSMVARFVSASTPDGFNPYRITSEGVDWEVPDPDDPWSGIGYWGDHQVVYLTRLLESAERHFPGELGALLDRRLFAYADVPYRIAPYEAILANPRATIAFDHRRAAAADARVAAIGGDGRLVHDAEGRVLRASLLEKLVVPVLAKLSSYVPGGGIWMNTERPEWNDANNALAGYGVSVVTACHLRRHLAFLERLLEQAGVARAPVAPEVAAWLRRVADVLALHRPAPGSGPVDDRGRRRIVDALGAAFSAYRERVYAAGLSAPEPLDVADVVALFRDARAHLEHTIRGALRPDGLYDSYGLLELAPDGTTLAVRRLEPMLEGQVAALSSGLLGPDEAAALVRALDASPLHRPDLDTFLLYPARALPSFLERNVVPAGAVARVPLLERLLAVEDASIVARDADGVVRFHPDLGTAAELGAALDALAGRSAWTAAVARDRDAVTAVFVDVFGHRTFTGRSGRMYAYEGIGCVYWHMVSKLLLAVQEAAVAAGGGTAAEELARAYRRVRRGLGFEKSAREYGAFPTDPYSHTPGHAGAQQPGMTGQTKESILARFGELGVRVDDGVASFEPTLLGRDEFLRAPGVLRYVDVAGRACALLVPAGALAFTWCQVPVVWVETPGASWIRVHASDGGVRERPGRRLTRDESRAVFEREGLVERIELGVPASSLHGG